MGSKYRCDPAVVRKCGGAELCGDHIYNGDDCECAKINQEYMPPTERQELATYRTSGLTPDKLAHAAELLKAEKEGRIQSMSCDGCQHEQIGSLEEHRAHCLRCIRNRYPEDHYTRAEAEGDFGGDGDD